MMNNLTCDVVEHGLRGHHAMNEMLRLPVSAVSQSHWEKLKTFSSAVSQSHLSA